MQCGRPTRWFELPLEGRVHTWTTCHFGSELFLRRLAQFKPTDVYFVPSEKA